ncbi:MAG: hypothetical protein HFI09_04115 [Bacilli bacterium]|nr:hypothetical protein [Bacilli bacterium]
MEQIEFKSVDGKLSFKLPWEWIEKDGIKPKTNDLEATAKRGKLNGRLYRKRQAQIPDHSLKFVQSLYRYQIKPLLNIIKQEQIKVFYFDDWADKFVETDFYVPKPDLVRREIPEDNNTDNILYAPFEMEFVSYGDVS